MSIVKTKVKLENGCTFVFIKKEKYMGVRAYDQAGKLLFPIREVIKLAEPKVGNKLSFSYDAGIDVDEFETTTKIVSIESEL